MKSSTKPIERPRQPAVVTLAQQLAGLPETQGYTSIHIRRECGNLFVSITLLKDETHIGESTAFHRVLNRYDETHLRFKNLPEDYECKHPESYEDAMVAYGSELIALQAVIEAYCARRVEDALDEQFTLRER